MPDLLSRILLTPRAYLAWGELCRKTAEEVYRSGVTAPEIEDESAELRDGVLVLVAGIAGRRLELPLAPEEWCFAERQQSAN